MNTVAVASVVGDHDERAEECRAWLDEFFAVDEGGCIRLATLTDRWHEYARGVRHDAGPLLGRGLSREDMLAGLAAALVAEADRGADVFACPYPHPGRRRKGAAIVRRHAHADIDGPVNLDHVRALGGMAVASGSVSADQRPHGHVYVRLARPVSPKVHAALCAAVGRYVGGEHHDTSKVSDEDVLRPTGTLNHKRGRVAVVRWLIAPGESVTAWEPEGLAARLGLRWPVSDAEGEEIPDDDVTVEGVDDALRAGTKTGPVAARLAGLVRAVTNAPVGEGNVRLNWAAFLGAALCATGADAPPADDVRADLMAAFLARSVPLGETPQRRHEEARRTVASGWRKGWADPARALAMDGDTDDESETVSTTTSTTDRAEATTGKGVDEVDVPTDDEQATFWRASPFYRSVLAFARARRVGPWALLGAVIARASASVPPSVVLPPTIGGVASLNLFVALCSESGGGKSAAMVAARDFLDARGGCSGYPVRSPGSGEGLLSQYVYVKRGDKVHAPQVVQRRLSVLFDVDEVGALGALAGRNGATLLPFLKTAWSGADLGTANAEAERDRQVEAHRYRLALVAGVQPVNAGIILDDEGGGFPQRWLWMPTHDPARPVAGEGKGEAPPWDWRVPGPPVIYDKDTGAIIVDRRREVSLPEEAVSAMLEAAEQRNRPIGAPPPAGATALDGHALLTRAKVAALLALLHGRVEVGAEEWARAGDVLAVSDHTRAAIASVRGEETAKADERKAARAGRSAAIAADAEVTERTARAVKVMLSGLERHKDKGEHSASAVRNFAGSRYRDVAAEALERVAASGLVTVTEREGTSGRRGLTRYYLWAVTS